MKLWSSASPNTGARQNSIRTVTTPPVPIRAAAIIGRERTRPSWQGRESVAAR